MNTKALVAGINRRGFLTAAGAAALSSVRAAGKTLRLGGPIFLKTEDPAEMAREHRRLGYSAAYCPRVGVSETARIQQIKQAFAEQGVIIAEVGAWVNMMDRDPAKRKANLTNVTERLALADAIGARTCVDISGSYNPTAWDGPDPRNYSKEFWDSTVENCRKVIDAVKPKQAKLSLEFMLWCPPDSPGQYLKLMKAIDRPAFGVHIDVCNIIESAPQFFNNAALTEECFKKLGRWVCSCHAKDLVGQRGHFAETIPGRGGIDYRAYLQAIATYSPDAPLMLEHLRSAEEYEEGTKYIQRVAREAGIPFA